MLYYIVLCYIILYICYLIGYHCECVNETFSLLSMGVVWQAR